MPHDRPPIVILSTAWRALADLAAIENAPSIVSARTSVESAPCGASDNAAGPGWHGITMRSEHRWRSEDRQVHSAFVARGTSAWLVDVIDHSPAWYVGIRSGAWITKIDGVSIEVFEARGAPVGARVVVEGLHPTRGPLFADLVLREPPKPKRLLPAIRFECGPTLDNRPDRPRWLKLLECASISNAAKVVGLCLCNSAIRDDGFTIARDGWTIDKFAKRLGMSRRTVTAALAELRHSGFLVVTSGQRSRQPNGYRLTWPQRPAQKIIPFPSAGTSYGSESAIS
jgi:biotin operon repressor